MAGHKHPSYLKIYIILVALFLLSVAGPEISHQFGAFEKAVLLFTAFGVAIWKAYLVCAHFMHLKTEKVYAPYILLACLSLLFVFFFGTATDVMFADGHNWEKPASEEAATEEAKARSHVLHAEHGEGDHGASPGEGHDGAPSGDSASHGEKKSH